MNVETIVKAMQREFDGGNLETEGKALIYDGKVSGHVIFMWESTVEDDDVKAKLKSLNCEVEMFGNGYAVIAV